jgi:rod shape-determining protein MreB
MRRFWRRSSPRLAALDVGTAFIRVGTPSDPVRAELATPTARPRPAMRRGVVNDVGAAAEALQDGLERARVRRWDLVVSAPASISALERGALLAALHAAGVDRQPILIEEPLAAAIGLGLDIAEDVPRLVVDVGHGITEAAIIFDGGIQALAACPVGCAELAGPAEERTSAPARRRSRGTAVAVAEGGAPAPDAALVAIGRTVDAVLAKAGLHTAAALDRLHLVGGGALIAAVGERLSSSTGLPIEHPPDPLHAVANGDAICADALAHHATRTAVQR